MSALDASQPLVIETRRTRRAAADARRNASAVNCLRAAPESGERREDDARRPKEPQLPSRSEAELHVSFRHMPSAPRWNATFVAQLLGQAMPQRGAGPSGALAAYQPPSQTAPVCDRRL